MVPNPPVQLHVHLGKLGGFPEPGAPLEGEDNYTKSLFPNLSHLALPLYFLPYLLIIHIVLFRCFWNLITFQHKQA
jgi:hypothetical protein